MAVRARATMGSNAAYAQRLQKAKMQRMAKPDRLDYIKLAAAEARVLAAGGKLTKDLFDFPGGRRFQFTDPCGNEFAFWSAPTATPDA